MRSQLKKKLFLYAITAKSDTKRAVCFSADRREEFCTYQAQKPKANIFPCEIVMISNNLILFEYSFVCEHVYKLERFL